jgi:hypothetical protein
MNTTAYRTHYTARGELARTELCRSVEPARGELVEPAIVGKRPRRKPARSRPGLTILEVALASALLIVALIPVIRSLTTAHMISSSIERKTYSLILAQGKLEKIRARAIYFYSDSFAETNASLGDSYLCKVDDDADPNLRTITVSVGRDENSDGGLGTDEVDVTLSTYIARRW